MSPAAIVNKLKTVSGKNGVRHDLLSYSGKSLKPCFANE